MNWRTGIIQGIGFCAFIVEDELPDTIHVRNVTIPQPVQDRQGRAGIAWSPWWPEQLEYALTPVTVIRDHIFALADAGEKAVAKAEEAWGMRKIQVPSPQGVVIPGGNGAR